MAERDRLLRAATSDRHGAVVHVGPARQLLQESGGDVAGVGAAPVDLRIALRRYPACPYVSRLDRADRSQSADLAIRHCHACLQWRLDADGRRVMVDSGPVGGMADRRDDSHGAVVVDPSGQEAVMTLTEQGAQGYSGILRNDAFPTPR